MSEELNSLLARIKNEGIEKAEAESKAIIESAKAQAAKICEKAEADAAEKRAAAERDAAAFQSRAEATVRQAMRDVKLQLATELEKKVDDFISLGVKKALSNTESVTDWVSKAVDSYLAQGEKGIEITLGGDVAKMADAVRSAIAKKAEQGGIEFESSPAFPNGFTVKLDNGRVEQCFTQDAITDALSRLLRPELADLLKDA